jgi:hypothetical protein
MRMHHLFLVQRINEEALELFHPLFQHIPRQVPDVHDA